ncbi:hypothetical protein [Nocardia sp. NPDC005366]|uniref:hypothetical protein n=1 Tax=Nocardia sp. NPDC005366 TaxID=3156878 RepID=UPI0033AED3EA
MVAAPTIMTAMIAAVGAIGSGSAPAGVRYTVSSAPAGALGIFGVSIQPTAMASTSATKTANAILLVTVLLSSGERWISGRAGDRALFTLGARGAVFAGSRLLDSEGEQTTGRGRFESVEAVLAYWIAVRLCCRADNPA